MATIYRVGLFSAALITGDGNLELDGLQPSSGFGRDEWAQLWFQGPASSGINEPLGIAGAKVTWSGTVKLQALVLAFGPNAWQDCGSDFSWTDIPSGPVAFQIKADRYRLNTASSTNPRIAVAW